MRSQVGSEEKLSSTDPKYRLDPNTKGTKPDKDKAPRTSTLQTLEAESQSHSSVNYAIINYQVHQTNYKKLLK